MGHHNPNHQRDMRRRSLFLLTPTWAKGTGISPRVLTSTYYFADEPHGPGHGLRSRTGLSSQYFRDPGACLRHYTSSADQSNIQDTFLLSHFLTRVLPNSSASYSLLCIMCERYGLRG